MTPWSEYKRRTWAFIRCQRGSENGDPMCRRWLNCHKGKSAIYVWDGFWRFPKVNINIKLKWRVFFWLSILRYQIASQNYFAKIKAVYCRNVHSETSKNTFGRSMYLYLDKKCWKLPVTSHTASKFLWQTWDSIRYFLNDSSFIAVGSVTNFHLIK